MKETALTITDLKSGKKYKIFTDGEVDGFGDDVALCLHLQSLPELIAWLTKRMESAESYHRQKLENAVDAGNPDKPASLPRPM